MFYAWAGVATEVAGLDTDYFALLRYQLVFDYYTPVIIEITNFWKEPETAKAFESVEKGMNLPLKTRMRAKRHSL